MKDNQNESDCGTCKRNALGEPPGPFDECISFFRAAGIFEVRNQNAYIEQTEPIRS